jgi:hypothetical protein
MNSYSGKSTAKRIGVDASGFAGFQLIPDVANLYQKRPCAAK